jgi:hypothetical protein
MNTLVEQAKRSGRHSLGSVTPTLGFYRFQTLVRAALTSAVSAPYKAALAAVGFTDTKHAALTLSRHSRNPPRGQ